jgi:hypothetical protein
MHEKLSHELTDGFVKVGFMDGMSKDDADQLSNPSKQEISFGGTSRKGSAVSNAERVFEQANGSFD